MNHKKQGTTVLTHLATVDTFSDTCQKRIMIPGNSVVNSFDIYSMDGQQATWEGEVLFHLFLAIVNFETKKLETLTTRNHPLRKC